LAKRGAVLGLIGLILGASGLGLGALAWLSVSNLENQVLEQTTWYKSNNATFASNPPFQYITYSDLTIEFELGSQESVYFSFSARVHTEQVASLWSTFSVFFRVDGIYSNDPFAQVGTYNGNEYINFMINLQDVRDDLSPGEHNVTVDIYGTSSANYIHYSSIFVQKFPT